MTEGEMSVVDNEREIVAVDMHVHLRDAKAQEFRVDSIRSLANFFGKANEVVSADELADIYRSHNMMAVLLNTTDAVATGRPSLPNDHIAEIVRAYPDVFIGFGVVDPRQGKLAEKEARRCREELGLAGIGELNPGRQLFAPNDPALLGLWRTLEELGLIVLFHGGYAAAGSGTAGGMGVKLSYNRPILLDDLAADCPNLRIICAHPSWPWQSEALAVVQHKGNVFLDLSGVAPKYFNDELRLYVSKRIPEKVLFGTDWPLLSVDRWVREFNDWGFDPAVTRKVFRDNALRLLGEG